MIKDYTPMKALALFALAALLAVPALVPASAQTTPIVIYLSSPDRVPAATATRTAEQRIVNVAQIACERPTLRSIRAQQLYRACVAEVTAELAARHQTAAPTVVASR